MPLRTRREAFFEDLEQAIASYHACGYLSDRERDQQLAVLKDLRKHYGAAGHLVRFFSQKAPKGGKTLRHLHELQEMEEQRPASNTVRDIDWLCAQRVSPQGFVAESIRAELADYKVPWAKDLYVFSNENEYVVAILDHLKSQSPPPGVGWTEGRYFTLYVDQRYDNTPLKACAPLLGAWRSQTLREMLPYRRSGEYDFAAYAAANGGGQFAATRGRKLIELCHQVEEDASSYHETLRFWIPEEGFFDDY